MTASSVCSSFLDPELTFSTSAPTSQTVVIATTTVENAGGGETTVLATETVSGYALRALLIVTCIQCTEGLRRNHLIERICKCRGKSVD